MARSDTENDSARFLTIVAERSGDVASEEQAECVSAAVLEALGECVTAGAADRLAGALPGDVAAPLRRASPQGQGAGTDEFLAAVAQRERSDDLTTVAGHVQAVFRAIAETVDEAAVGSVREQLTAELRNLLSPERQGDTTQRQASGPRDPEAPNLAGPERPVN